MYTLRERPQTAPKPVMDELERISEDSDGGLLGLPETETELDVSYLNLMCVTLLYVAFSTVIQFRKQSERLEKLMLY